MQAQRTAWVEGLAVLHGQMVFAAAYRVLGNADDAEDVLQTVFLKLLGDRLEQVAVQEWGAYLRVAAVRQAVDLLRQRARRPVEPMETVENVAESNGASPREVIDSRRAAERLRAALAQLTERDARIFAMRFFEEISYEEIAAREKTGISQVGVSIHRSRKRLREILEPERTPAAPSGKI